jgi:protein-disulfide isomerase
MLSATRLMFAAAVGVGVGFLTVRLLPPTPAAVQAFLEAKPTFLVDHQELIERARPVAEARTEQQIREQRRNIVRQAWGPFLGAASMPRAGRVTDPVVVIEFTDFGCVPCKRSAERTAYVAASNPDTQFIMAYMPSADAGAELAARAAIAVWAREPDRFLDVHRKLMAEPIPALQGAVEGLFPTDDPRTQPLWLMIGSNDVQKELQATRTLAQQLGVRGLPSYVIDGQLLTGPVSPSELALAIQAARSREVRPPS